MYHRHLTQQQAYAYKDEVVELKLQLRAMKQKVKLGVTLATVAARIVYANTYDERYVSLEMLRKLVLKDAYIPEPKVEPVLEAPPPEPDTPSDGRVLNGSDPYNRNAEWVKL